MMLNDVMQEAINDQINNELFAMYSYLSMSAYCEHKQFRGCAHWMRVQSQEEHVHAMRLYNFLIARQGRVKLGGVARNEKEKSYIVEAAKRVVAASFIDDALLVKGKNTTARVP